MSSIHHTHRHRRCGELTSGALQRLTRQLTTRARVVLPLLALATACGGASEPPAPAPTTSAVASRAATQASTLTRELVQLARSYEGNPAVSHLESVLRAASRTFGFRLPSDSLTDIGLSLLDGSDDREALGDRLARYLRERILVEAHRESGDPASATFLIPGAAACSDLSGRARGECIRVVDEAQVRVVATPGGEESIDLAVQIGSRRAQPVLLRLGKGLFSAEVDWAAAREALAFVAAAEGRSTSFPQAAGRLRIDVLKNGEHDFSVFTSIQQTVDLQEAAHGYALSVPEWSPLASLRAQGAKSAVEVEVSLPRVLASAPYAELSHTARAGKVLKADLAGLSGALRLDGSRPQELLITGVGAGPGPSRLELDGVPLLEVGLDAAGSRTFGVQVVKSDDDLLEYRFRSTALDVDLRLLLAPLLADAPIADWVRDDEIAVHLEGAPPSLKPLPPLPGISPGALMVVRGTLRLSTTYPNVPALVATEGRCILRDPARTEGHPLRCLVVGDCP